jgi:ATP-dependent Clp protease ATP-binding subunit ClpA
MLSIVDLQMQEIEERLGEQGLTVSLTAEARTWLANEGYEEQFGARPLRRALQRHVESPLSVKLLKGEYVQGDHVLIDVKDHKLVFRKQAEAPARVPAPAPADMTG